MKENKYASLFNAYVRLFCKTSALIYSDACTYITNIWHFEVEIEQRMQMQPILRNWKLFLTCSRKFIIPWKGNYFQSYVK